MTRFFPSADTALVPALGSLCPHLGAPTQLFQALPSWPTGVCADMDSWSASFLACSQVISRILKAGTMVQANDLSLACGQILL